MRILLPVIAAFVLVEVGIFAIGGLLQTFGSVWLLYLAGLVLAVRAMQSAS